MRARLLSVDLPATRLYWMGRKWRRSLARKTEVTPSSAASSEVDRFVRELGQLAPRPAGTRGRLLFALDATASREPTWDLATSLQGEMFVAAAENGGAGKRAAFSRRLDG